MLELTLVLESVYKISRDEILNSLSNLLLMPILNLEKQSLIRQVIRSCDGNKYDLSDILIAHSAKCKGCDTIITFDKKASQFSLFELVK